MGFLIHGIFNTWFFSPSLAVFFSLPPSPPPSGGGDCAIVCLLLLVFKLVPLTSKPAILAICHLVRMIQSHLVWRSKCQSYRCLSLLLTTDVRNQPCSHHLSYPFVHRLPSTTPAIWCCAAAAHV